MQQPPLFGEPAVHLAVCTAGGDGFYKNGSSVHAAVLAVQHKACGQQEQAAEGSAHHRQPVCTGLGQSGTISITKANVTAALGYTPPTANTWRGVQDNLTSTATDQSLSANQGKVLKGLVDGKAASSHTHDDRYYTESEMNTKLNGKANASHTHDDRYYTESEMNTKLNGKANSSHTHNYAGSGSAGGTANSVNGLTFAAQTTDPGAGSSLATNKVLIVYV